MAILDQDVFMEQPEGCRDTERPDFVYKLQKALYGLKQAPRQWYAKIDSFLTKKLQFIKLAIRPLSILLQQRRKESVDIPVR